MGKEKRAEQFVFPWIFLWFFLLFQDKRKEQLNQWTWSKQKSSSYIPPSNPYTSLEGSYTSLQNISPRPGAAIIWLQIHSHENDHYPFRLPRLTGSAITKSWYQHWKKKWKPLKRNRRIVCFVCKAGDQWSAGFFVPKMPMVSRIQQHQKGK